MLDRTGAGRTTAPVTIVTTRPAAVRP